MLDDPNKIIFMILAYSASIGLLYYTYYTLILASNDEKAFTKNLFKNVFIIVVPVILIFGLITVVSFETTTATYLIFGSLFIAVLFFISIYFLESKLSKYIFNKYLLYIVIAAILLIGLSIVVTLFSGTLKKLTGWTGFFINLLFYIPCMIRDIVQAGIQEYNTFSVTLFVLFIIEIVLLMIYFFLIPFVNYKIYPQNLNLIMEPIMLHRERQLKVPSDISNNFALSMWVYVNPGPLNKVSYSVESPIFSFLDASGNKHIGLTYSNTEANNDFIMYVGENAFPLSKPLQKWNHFVFNYTTYNEAKPGKTLPPVVKKKWYEWWYTVPISTPNPLDSVKKTTVDMFVNGHLERSHTYDEPLPVFSPVYDSISIGSANFPEDSIFTSDSGVKSTTGKNSNIEGLYGAICNMNYYNKPLTKLAIVYDYNLHIIKNPPI